jgi:hypothetical protein
MVVYIGYRPLFKVMMLKYVEVSDVKIGLKVALVVLYLTK